MDERKFFEKPENFIENLLPRFQDNGSSETRNEEPLNKKLNKIKLFNALIDH